MITMHILNNRKFVVALFIISIFFYSQITSAQENTLCPITKADSVIAVYVEDWGLFSGEPPKLVFAVWDAPAAVRKLAKLGAKITRNKAGEVVAVSLRSKKFADDDLKLLQQLPALRDLDLFETRVGDKGLKHLATLTKLKNLDLAFCRRISDTGIEQLKNLKELEVLNLGFCRKVTAEGLDVLKEFRKMKTLNLSITEASDDVLKNLKTMKHLENLDLDSTQITDDGLINLKDLKKLRSLRLEGTSITDKGLIHLEQLKNLKHLRVRNTHISKDGIAKIKKAIAGLTVR